MRKSKTKYDSLADEYDRARTGEPRQGGKVFGAFKTSKSSAQHEEDMLKKVQVADQTYHGHVQVLQEEKSQLETSIRPTAVRALQDLIRETDSALTLQMQRFASFGEKLLLGNGLIISPLRGHAGTAAPSRSLRESVHSIDNVKDLNEYIVSHHSRVPPSNSEVKYERNPVLAPQQGAMSQPPAAQSPLNQNPTSSTFSPPPPQTSGTVGGLPSLDQQHSFGMAARANTGGFGAASPPPRVHSPPMGQGQGPPPPHGGPMDPNRAFANQHNRNFSGGNAMAGPPGNAPPHHYNQAPPSHNPHPYSNGGSISSGPPQLGALPFQGSSSQGPSPQVAPASFQPSHDRRPSGAMLGSSAPPSKSQAPVKPVFGVSLNRLYERDGLAVPLVVYQCIQAVDLFGLGLEGIYRQSGSLTHITRLKTMFDNESQSPALDFRNPENFYHDVNSVTSLLKQFFRDLPDPLFTNEHHASFIAAAKQDDEVVRRDSLHAVINNLPDPNYATLRALALHLHRVMDKSNVNRMNSHNLAVIFGPTLMGTDPSTAIADAGWQIKVIDTMLQNTYQIFDED